MKKRVKKLVLAKETVRSLRDLELPIVLGGSTVGLLTCGPEYSCYETFASERNC